MPPDSVSYAHLDAGHRHVSSRCRPYDDTGDIQARHAVSGRPVRSHRRSESTTTRTTGKRPMRRRSRPASRSTPGLVYGVDYPETHSYRLSSASATTVDGRLRADGDHRRRYLPPRGAAHRYRDADRRLGSDHLRHGLHHRPADVGARCARAAAACLDCGTRSRVEALLKFVERGHAIVETLTADDLGRARERQPGADRRRGLAGTRKRSAAAACGCTSPTSCTTTR